ncbi:MAG: thermonuclease family protein [Phycisphaerae bacterium]
MPPPNNYLAALLAKHVLRKRLAVLAVILPLIALRLWGCQNEKSAATAIADDDYSRYNNRIFTCVKVVDGDTIDIGIPDPKSQKPKAYTRIRLWGIDTPEIPHSGKPAVYYGYQAAEFARKLMAGKKIRLELIEGYTREKFGRLLAYAYLPDGRMYNELALTEGFAYAETRFKHPRMRQFIQMESDARKNLRGLWPEITPDQLPHWYKPSKLNDFWDSRTPTTNSAFPKLTKKHKTPAPWD